MTTKEFSDKVHELIKKAKKNQTCLRFDEVALILDKTPTTSQIKTLIKFIQLEKSCLYTTSQYTEIQNIVDAQQEEDFKREEYIRAISEKYDISKENELLEWSRSDSPVRMYLREMGQVPLLEKDDEVELAKQIELGQDIILDAISSVPYLIDFILDYKEPLINRERRVKELFKSFEDSDDKDDEEENSDGKDKDREKQVIDSFKLLEKTKKDWMKSVEELELMLNEHSSSDLKVIHEHFKMVFKKEQLKQALLEL